MPSTLEPFIARESLLNLTFRGHMSRDWEEWSRFATSAAADVALDAERAWLTRTRSSHRGIGDRKKLRHLIAGAADQAYLEEICTITGLERLELEYPVTATSLAPLAALQHLRHLSIDSPRNIDDFSPLLGLASLRTLLLTNARRMTNIDWLAEAHHLEVIGIEGSMWTAQRIPTLAPLAGLASLRALLATSTRLDDADLSPLAQCPRLEFLGCAQFAPLSEFERLSSLKPELVCAWFRPEMWRMLRR